MFCYEDFWANALTQLKQQGNYRYFNQIQRLCGHFPKALRFDSHHHSRDIIVWCANDYLGMGQNPQVIQAMHAALDQVGGGAGGTRNISGTTTYHVELEHELAALHQTEASLLFTSGYVANYTTISTLGSKIPGCILISDSKNHASIIEGIRHSRAEKHVFRHNDMAHLQQILESLPVTAPKIIIFESVYSMDGDTGNIQRIVELAKQYNCLTYLDEVHAVGMYGPQGAGIAASLSAQIDIIQATLGKAFGLIGGYIAGKANLIDYIRSFAPGFIFTTALPPVIAAGAIASIRYVRNHPEIQTQFFKNVDLIKALLKQANINFLDNGTHIIPIIIGDPNLCLQISQELIHESGIYLQPINYPTVPRGTERFRVTPSAAHSESMVHDFVTALEQKLIQHKIPNLHAA